MPQSIVQVSDLHFGTVIPHVANALIAKINQLNPDLFVVSGDITQRSLSYQFKEAQAFLDQINCSNQMVLPGNHDIPFYKFWYRLFDPTHNFDRFMKERTQDYFETEELAMLGVNSCNPSHYKNGRLTKGQLKRIEKVFKNVGSQKLKVIVFHHPVDVYLPEDEENLIANSNEIVKCFEVSNIDLVMGGHIHFPFSRSLKQRYPWLKRDIFVCQAGTATSLRVRSSKPNSFMHIVSGVNRNYLRIEQWDFNHEKIDFELVNEFQPYNENQKRI